MQLLMLIFSAMKIALLKLKGPYVKRMRNQAI